MVDDDEVIWMSTKSKLITFCKERQKESKNKIVSALQEYKRRVEESNKRTSVMRLQIAGSLSAFNRMRDASTDKGSRTQRKAVFYGITRPKDVCKKYIHEYRRSFLNIVCCVRLRE